MEPDNVSTSNKIFIGNINFSTSKNTLKDVFSQYGTVTDVSIPIYHDTRRPKGFAFITFDNPTSATEALKYDKEIDGRKVIINKATPEKKAINHQLIKEEI